MTLITGVFGPNGFIPDDPDYWFPYVLNPATGRVFCKVDPSWLAQHGWDATNGATKNGFRCVNGEWTQFSQTPPSTATVGPGTTGNRKTTRGRVGLIDPDLDLSAVANHTPAQSKKKKARTASDTEEEEPVASRASRPSFFQDRNAQPTQKQQKRTFTKEERKDFAPSTMKEFKEWGMSFHDWFELETLTAILSEEDRYAAGVTMRKWIKAIKAAYPEACDESKNLYTFAVFFRGSPYFDDIMSHLIDVYPTMVQEKKNSLKSYCRNTIWFYCRPDDKNGKPGVKFREQHRYNVNYMKFVAKEIEERIKNNEDGAAERYKDYSICAKTIYIEWFLEQYRDAPSETPHRSGMDEENPQGSKYGALKLGHSYVGNVLGQLSQILAGKVEGIGCSKGGNQCKMHNKIVNNEKVDSKSRTRKVNPDRQDNLEFHIEKLISFRIRKTAKLYHLARPRHKGHRGLRDLNMACLNEVSCERSVELRHLEYLDLAVRRINLAEEGVEGLSFTDYDDCSLILLEGTKLQHICAELGINDSRYIIIGQHWHPLFDYGFTHALMEFEEQHMYGITAKVDELLKGYKSASKLKVYDAGSLFAPMDAKTHSRSVDEMQKAIGIKVVGKGTHLVRKQGPYLLEKANVSRDGIKSVGWLIGQGESGSFDKGYFKNFHRSVTIGFKGCNQTGFRGWRDYLPDGLESDTPPQSGNKRKYTEVSEENRPAKRKAADATDDNSLVSEESDSGEVDEESDGEEAYEVQEAGVVDPETDPGQGNYEVPRSVPVPDALLKDLFPKWWEFQRRVANPNDPIFEGVENRPSNDDEADDEQDWRDNSAFAENGSGVVGHRKFGRISLVELGKVFARRRIEFVQGIASCIWHSKWDKQFELAWNVLWSVMERYVNKLLISKKEWLPFYNKVAAREESFNKWMMSFRSRQSQTGTSQSTSSGSSSSSVDLQALMNQFRVGTQSLGAQTRSLVEELFKEFLGPIHEEVTRNRDLTEQVLEMLKMMGDCDRERPEPPASNTVPESTQVTTAEALFDVGPPASILPQKYETVPGFIVEYAATYSPSEKNNIPSVTLPGLGKLSLEQVQLFIRNYVVVNYC
ncbi:hypothetical protein HDU79_006437 [Rhizoclosmatium sp. JEL0117]|nr:hypothetical protein HDU79_006437 [Rhizoclosmatium sp. JEL0117]